MRDNLIEKLILEIVENMDEADASLMHGKSGMLVSFCYYYKTIEDLDLKLKINNAINRCIDLLLEDIEKLELNGSFGFGLAGIAYSFRIAYDLGHKDKINLEWLDDMHEIVKDSFNFCLANKEFDFLRGASGIIIYLVNCGKENDLLELYIRKLEQEALWTENRCHWIFYSFDENQRLFKYDDRYVNLGLAHGMASIVNLLTEIYSRVKYKKRIENLLEGAINFLISVKTTHQVSSYCGIYDKDSSIQATSKLGWCYGDTSVGISILKAGFQVNNSGWKELGNEICLKSANRSLEDAGLDDHGFCHGYFGAAHIYGRLYELTNEPIYVERKEYWLENAFQKRDYNVHNLGFYSSILENKNLYKFKSFGLLEGLSGIALVLCSSSYYENSSQHTWDSLFLTNII